MPITNNKYQAPTWVNEAAPAIDADEMQAICDTVEKNQTESAGDYHAAGNLTVDGTTELNGAVSTNAGLSVAGSLTQGGKAVALAEDVEAAQTAAENAQQTADTARIAAAGKLPLSGGTITGALGVTGNVSAAGGFFTRVSIGGVPEADFIAAQGRSGKWRYWKWNSGLAVCIHDSITGSGDGNFNNNQGVASWGDWFDLPEYTFSAYPFTFSEMPTVYASRTTAHTTDYNGKLVFIAQSGGSTTKPPVFDIARPNMAVIGGPQLNMTAIGRWK